MPTTLISTGIQFPDSTVQTTAASSGGGMNALIYEGTPGTPNAFNYTLPATVKSVRVTVVGGGGSGATRLSGPTNGGVAGGGAGGAATAVVIPRATLIATYPTGVIPAVAGGGGVATPTASNAGGTSSFGNFVSATGGSGGQTRNYSGTPQSSAGGAAGVGSGSSPNYFLTPGSNGGAGSAGGPAGAGGAVFSRYTYLGGPGGGGITYSPGLNQAGNPAPAFSFGGGGGGAMAGTGTVVGGVGGDGILIIEEYS
jgi:hypothetical protein